MKCLLIVCLCSLAWPLQAAEFWQALSEDEWSRPRSAEVVREFPGVAALVNQWLAYPQGQIEIRYPGGESGNLWALELRDWLVVLGVPSAQIETQPGHSESSEVAMVLYYQER